MEPLILAECLRNAAVRLRKFREEYGVWTAPVDTFRLLREITERGKIRVQWEKDASLPEEADAFTVCSSDGDTILIVTREIPLNWKKISAWRRNNFTMAHELGHIFCGHVTTPNAGKSPAVREMEDAEADAFAAGLLTPAEALGHFCSVKEAAEALLVSESAIRRRMRDTGILFAIRTCPKCGFDRIPPAADYCRMCGQSLQANPHPPAEHDVRYLPPLPEECPICGLKETGAPEGRCMNCDNPKLNHCLPEYDQRQHWCPADALFCETCGARTLYSELLKR